MRMSKFEHASSGREMVCLANSNGGPCHLLGPLVGETRFYFIYRARTSPRAYVPKRLARLLYTVAAGLEGDGE